MKNTIKFFLLCIVTTIFIVMCTVPNIYAGYEEQTKPGKSQFVGGVLVCDCSKAPQTHECNCIVTVEKPE